jgi:hypothetical protein
MKRQLIAIFAALSLSVGCSTEAEKPAEAEDVTADPPAVETVREPVAPGIGRKGRNYGSGPVATPIRALFSTKERLVFDVQIPNALNIYKAINGNFPKTHEEFMKEIIKANGIKLPELPEGHKYVYDPETHKLMNEHH